MGQRRNPRRACNETAEDSLIIATSADRGRAPARPTIFEARESHNYWDKRRPGCGRLDFRTPEQREREVGLRSTNRHDIALPDVVSAAQWRKSFEAMLVKEKALTVARDELAAERRRMPIMRVDANYRFIGPQGEVGLLDLFEGRMQLMIYRFFYAEDVEGWPDAGCNGLLALRRQRHPSRAPQRPGHHVGLRIGDDPGSHRGLPRADRVGRRRLTELRSARHARVGRAVCEPYPSQLASVALPPRSPVIATPDADPDFLPGG